MSGTIGAVVRCGDQVAQVYASLTSLLGGSRKPDAIAIVAEPSTPVAAAPWLEAFARSRGLIFLRADVARPGAAWNAGLREIGPTALGICLEAGDLLEHRALELLERHFDSDDVVLVTSGVEWMGPGGRRRFTAPAGCTAAHLLEDFHAAHASSLFRRDAWLTAGTFDEGLPALEHTDLWLRMLRSHGRAGIVDPRPLLRRAVRPNALYRRTWATEEYAAAVRTLIERHKAIAEAVAGPMLEARDREYHRTLARYQQALETEREATADARRAIAAREAALAPLSADWESGVARHALTRTSPFSHDWGYDRGTPVDRPLIEAFLQGFADDIHGAVLEIQEDDYTRRFGADRVERGDVLDIDPANRRATIIGDLRSLDHVPADSYDTIILTQTLHVIDDMAGALRECHRLLKPGGVLLATLPAGSRVCLEYGRDADYWRVTAAGARHLFSGVFSPAAVETVALGNAGVNAAFSLGLASEELPPDSFQSSDPYFPLVVGVHAVKTAGPPVVAGAGRSPAHAASLTSAPGVIMLYHRVGACGPDPHRLSVTPDTFAAQLDWLQATCSVMALGDLIQAVRDGALPPRSVALTFDDGYLDNLTVASPILLSRGVPATFFLTTAQIDEAGPYRFWWDRLASALTGDTPVPSSVTLDLPDRRETMSTATAGDRLATHWRVYHAIVRLPAVDRDVIVDEIESWAGKPSWRPDDRRLSGDEARTLASCDGHAIGAHTVHHLMLPGHPDEIVFRELRDCRDTLERLLDRPVRVAAYPFGAADARVAAVARRAGFDAALTCDDRPVRPRLIPLRLPRLAAQEEPLDRFIARVEQTFSLTAAHDHQAGVRDSRMTGGA